MVNDLDLLSKVLVDVVNREAAIQNKYKLCLLYIMWSTMHPCKVILETPLQTSHSPETYHL